MGPPIQDHTRKDRTQEAQTHHRLNRQSCGQPLPPGVEPNRELQNTQIEDIPKVNAEGIQRAAKRIANRKAPGPDEIPAEILKILMLKRPEIFARMTDKILHEGRFPEKWKTAKLVLIPKQGKPDAYRPICLLNTAAKALVNNRLQEELENPHEKALSQKMAHRTDPT